MKEVAEFGSLTSAYQNVLRDVLYYPQYECAPRGLKIREILNYTFSVVEPIAGPIITANLRRNAIIADYTKAEFKLFDDQATSAEEFARAASFWKQLANPDGTVNSAYGHLIFGRKCCGNPEFESKEFEHGRTSPEPWMRSPWNWALESLKSDKDSRQAILHFNTPDFAWVGNKDQVCTIFGQFILREDQLHFTVHMRSNDVVKGLVYDCVWFTSLMEKARQELLPTYPNIKIGTYTHMATSMHIYQNQFELAESMLHPSLRLNQK